jgi:hypothetical protein
MAAKKSTPARPGASSPRGTANPKGYGSRKGTKVTKITGSKRALAKGVVRNPDAPKPAPTSGAVKPITKSETFMKKGNAKDMNKPTGKGGVPVGRGGVTPKKYKESQSDKIRRELKISPYKNRRPNAPISNARGGRGMGGGMLGGGGMRGPVIK